MRRIEEPKFSVAFFKHKLTKTGVSASIDTLGAEDVKLTIITGSAAQAQKFYFYHASGSTTLAASGTAFGTIPTLTTAATASQRHAVDISGQVGRKRYVIVKMSSIAASNNTVVICQQWGTRAIPTSSTQGSYTSVVRPLV